LAQEAGGSRRASSTMTRQLVNQPEAHTGQEKQLDHAGTRRATTRAERRQGAAPVTPDLTMIVEGDFNDLGYAAPTSGSLAQQFSVLRRPSASRFVRPWWPPRSTSTPSTASPDGASDRCTQVSSVPAKSGCALVQRQRRTRPSPRRPSPSANCPTTSRRKPAHAQPWRGRCDGREVGECPLGVPLASRRFRPRTSVSA